MRITESGIDRKGLRTVSSLAHYLTAQMEAVGISASDLAAASGVPKQTLSHLMTGKNKEAPELRTLAALAQALKVNVAALIEASGYVVGQVHDDEESQRLARLIRQIPWIASGVQRMLELPPDELRSLLGYMEYRVSQYRKE